MGIEEYIPHIISIIKIIIEVIGGICVVATLIVRMTKTDLDDKAVSKFTKKFLDLLDMAPTLGENPRTKELKKFYAEKKSGTDAQSKP